ncbi:MAG: RNA methyltransferase [Planctomycetota bacterium]
MTDPDSIPFRLRRAETILRRRTSRLVLILERPWNDDNVQAVVRTAESFGVQHVWTIKHPHQRRRAHRSVTRGSHLWITRRFFREIGDCIDAAREEGLELWVTDLDDGAIEVTSPADLAPFPERVAIVIGREMAGVGPELREAADRRIYLPMHGFTESFNLSVATALVLQRCFDADPTLVGAIDEDERAALRRDWFVRLAGKNEARREVYRRWAESPPEPLPSTRPSSDSRTPRIKKGMWGYFDE